MCQDSCISIGDPYLHVSVLFVVFVGIISLHHGALVVGLSFYHCKTIWGLFLPLMILVVGLRLYRLWSYFQFYVLRNSYTYIFLPLGEKE